MTNPVAPEVKFPQGRKKTRGPFSIHTTYRELHTSHTLNNSEAKGVSSTTPSTFQLKWKILEEEGRVTPPIAYASVRNDIAPC